MTDTRRTGPASISVVVPFFNEGRVGVEAFFAETVPVLEQLGADYEIIAVDDGSQDDTAATLSGISESKPQVKVLSLSRNHGHQLALTAGLDHAFGDMVVMMDGDLQDPPALIPTMVERWRDGVDVVYGQRTSRAGVGLLKRSAYHVFYRLLAVISEVEIPLDAGDFRLLDQKIVGILRACPERNRFLRGLVSWAGFQQCSVAYDRPSRFAGETKYSLKKLFALAADGVFSFSRKPLRLATWTGLVCALLALGYLAWVVFRGIFFREEIAGWYSLISAILFLGSFQLLCMGLIGEYVGRIYEESKARPLYLIRERIGFDLPDGAKPTDRGRPS